MKMKTKILFCFKARVTNGLMQVRRFVSFHPTYNLQILADYEGLIGPK